MATKQRRNPVFPAANTGTGASPTDALPTTRKRAKSDRRVGNNKVPIELTMEREAQAWELHKLGYSQTEIAKQLTDADPKHPIGQQAVSKALRRVQETLVSDLTDKVDRYKVSQLGRLEGIYLQAMSSYRSSKGVKKKAKRSAAKGRLSVTQESTTNEPGDPRWLEKAMDALRDQRKILGIDAPVKFDGVVKTDRPLEDMDEAEMLAEHDALQTRIAELTKKRRGR
jgi:hypothetical protein